MRALLISPGDRFGRLVVLAQATRPPDRRSRGRWFACRCDCGGHAVVTAGALRSGGTSSCGCLFREHVARISRAKATHRMSDTATYRSWRGMVARCTDPADRGWKFAGGRGVRVCDRWLPAAGGSFENFVADLGVRPDGLRLVRIDRDGDYEPGNVRWAAPDEFPRKNGRFA
jgi:hypothetical protein